MTNSCSCPNARDSPGAIIAPSGRRLRYRSNLWSSFCERHAGNWGAPSLDMRCNDGADDDDDAIDRRPQFFTLHRPLLPSLFLLPSIPLKTNNERDQSLAALMGRRRAGPSLGDGRATRKMFEGILLLARLLAPSVPLHLHSHPQAPFPTSIRLRID